MKSRKATNQSNKHPLTERYLLEKTFESPVLLSTYDGGKRIDVKLVYKYAIHSTKGERFDKMDVLFAFPASKFDDVKPGIKIQKAIQAQKLRTPQRIQDRPLVVSDEQLRQDTGRRVRLLMRSGHVLRGELVFVSKDNLFLRIAGKMVLVYRHGLLEYEMCENAPSRRNHRTRVECKFSRVAIQKWYLCVLFDDVRWILCIIFSVSVVRFASTYRR